MRFSNKWQPLKQNLFIAWLPRASRSRHITELTQTISLLGNSFFKNQTIVTEYYLVFLTLQNNAIFFVYQSIVSKVSFFIFFPTLKKFKLSELVKNYAMAKKIQNLPIILSKNNKSCWKEFTHCEARTLMAKIDIIQLMLL